jgi:hypothetical protein
VQLDAIVGGDNAVASIWLKDRNTAIPKEGNKSYNEGNVARGCFEEI